MNKQGSKSCLLFVSLTWMCSSRGTGRTLGWKLKVAVVLQPSQWATSLALEREELRATMRMGRSIWEEMYLILEQITSSTGWGGRDRRYGSI